MKRSLVTKDANGVERKNLVCPFEFKEGDKIGTFSGFGSIFDNEDLGGDIVVGPEPFKKFKLTKDKKVRVLYQHDAWQPVGKFTPVQTERGLQMPDAELVMEMPAAAIAYAGMKSGLLDGLSVGFNILPKGAEWDDENKVRRLTKLELWEVSIVTFGMNPLAKITSVKAANGIKTKREFEEFLRESGFPKAFAVQLAKAWPDDEEERGGIPPDHESAKAIQDLFGVLRSINTPSQSR